MKMPEFLTLREAALFLKVSRRTLYNWRNAGKLEIFRIAGYPVRVKADDVMKLIQPEKEKVNHERD